MATKIRKDREIITFDYAMKNILREKANFDILSGFLTELLDRKVTVLEILESEGNADDPADKVNRVDLKAKVSGGEIAIFEIQYADQYDFFGKMLFNVGRAIVEQVKKGGFYDIKKVYMIGIANFDLGAERDYLFTAKMSGFKGVNFDETIPFSRKRGELSRPSPKNMEIDIHPEYYLILPQKFDDKIRRGFDEWVYMLKNNAVKKSFKAAGLQEAAARLDWLKMTEKERYAYDRHLRATTDLNSMFLTARMNGEAEGMAKGMVQGIARGEAIGRAEGEAKGRAEGEAKGRVEGEAKGRAEGEAKGRAEGEAIGRAEGEAKGLAKGMLQAAKAMKAQKITTKTISEITGLTPKEIAGL